MRRPVLLVLMVSSLLLAGCADEGYDCPTPEACAPVHETFREAQSDTSWSGWAVGEASGHTSGSRQAHTTIGHTASLGALAPSVADAVGGPVYVPPTPWRAWLAPWSDGRGRLVSGDYVWFVTPGHWHYLGRDLPADAAAGDAPTTVDTTIAPVAPDDLGFAPGETTKNATGIIDNMAQPKAFP